MRFFNFIPLKLSFNRGVGGFFFIHLMMVLMKYIWLL